MKKNRKKFFKCRSKTALGVCLLACFAGCTVGPDYAPPTVDVPEKYANATLTKESATSEELSQWWDMLADPILTDLILTALQSSPDTRTAMAKVDQARSELAYVAGEKLPKVYKAAELQFRRDSQNDGLGTTVLTDIPGVEIKDTPYMFTGVVAQWEIDLFGRIRRAVESATAQYQASIEEYRGVRVSLAAEIAATYINIRALQKRIDIATANIEGQRRSLEIVELRHQAGEAPELEIAQAKANLAASESKLPLLQRDLVYSLNSLGVLTGNHPGSLNEALNRPAPPLAAPRDFPQRLPAELLRRRPDIRRTERLLASQTARVGIATADLYPRFTLMGDMGTLSIKSDRAFETGSFTYSIGPSIRWRLFDGNRVKSAIAVENARVDQALVEYEKSVLNALKDVEDAHAAYQRQAERNIFLAKAVTEYKRAVELAVLRYKEGQTGFLDVLDAERSLLDLEDQLAKGNAAQLKNMVFLYRSLGGGWDWIQDSME
jgi:NodT family efflux transporter outer membrane factor (OMF) lipoprotein